MTVVNSLASDASSNKALPSSAQELPEGNSSEISHATLHQPSSPSSDKGSRRWLFVFAIFCLYADYVVWGLLAKKNSGETAQINVTAPTKSPSNTIAASGPSSIINVLARQQEPPQRGDVAPRSLHTTSITTALVAGDKSAAANDAIAEASPPPPHAASIAATASITANDGPAQAEKSVSEANEPPQRADVVLVSSQPNPIETVAKDEPAQADVSRTGTRGPPQQEQVVPLSSQSTSMDTTTSLAAKDEFTQVNMSRPETQEAPQREQVAPLSSQSPAMETTTFLVAKDEPTQADVSRPETQEPPQREEVASLSSSQAPARQTMTSLAASDRPAAVNAPLAEAGPAPAPDHNSSHSVRSALGLDRDEISWLLERAEICLMNGDVAGARVLLGRAADAGSAEAAMQLGATFDPFSLRQHGVIGIRPDIASAQKWYQRAAELGSTAATAQLAKLNSMH